MIEKDNFELTDDEQDRIEGYSDQMSGPQAQKEVVKDNARNRRITGANYGQQIMGRLEESSRDRQARERADAEARTEDTIQLLRDTDPDRIKKQE